MKKPPSYTLFLLGCLLLAGFPGQAQKKVYELTIVYDYSVLNSTGAGTNAHTDAVENSAVHTIYIKGNKSRSEIISPLFSSTTFYDAGAGNAVILKEVSGQKLLIRLNAANWAERNRLDDGIVYKNTGEAKEIASYKCIKAVGQTASGTIITVFYTKDLIPDNRQYDPQFRTLDGLPLEYELTNGNVKIRYRVSRINLNPVPESKFDLPVAGYREMNYEESKKMNIGG